MIWTRRATSAKCQVCGHGYSKEKTWSASYAVCKQWFIGWCRACGRTEKVSRV